MAILKKRGSLAWLQIGKRTSPEPFINDQPASKNKSYDELWKLLLIGDATVGKTNILRRYSNCEPHLRVFRFVDHTWESTYISTRGKWRQNVG
jgi:hypothetical protein